MGTRKRFLLASLMSVVLALAFLIGVMPGSENARLGANSDDQVDMAALLDLMLTQDKGADLGVQSSIDAVLVKTPEDNFQTPVIPVPVAATGADNSESVRFVALGVDNEAVWAGSDPMSASGQWTGDSSISTDEVFGPVFASAVNVGNFVTGTANFTQVLGIYALANTISSTKQVETILYDRASAPQNAVTISLTEVQGGATGVDSDGNAFPDNILNDVGPGEIWTANVNTTGGVRTVLIANLDTTAKGGGGPISVVPAAGVTVTAPAADAYPASVVQPGDNVILIAEVVGDLEGLLDAVNPGGESFSDPAGWADAVEGLVPSGRDSLGSYIEISLLAGSGGTFTEIDSLDGTGLSVTLTLEGLTTDAGTSLELLSYPTQIASDADGITNVPGLQSWGTVSGVSATDTSLTAELTSFSVFQPVQVPAISLTSVDPSTIPANTPTALKLTGVVPVGAAMNMATAQMYYQVTVGGVNAPFRDVSGIAISAADAMYSANMLYVTSPSLAASKQANFDVALFDLVADPNNPAATLVQSVQVLNTYSLGVSSGGNGSASASPGPNGGNGEYFSGTSVNLTAVADANYVFVAWTGDTANIVDPSSATTSITMLADSNVTATFAPIGPIGADLTISFNGPGTVNVSGDSPVTISGTTRTYPTGSTQNLTAVPDAGFQFVNWTGTAAAALADATAQNIQLTLNADTDITANFAPQTGALELAVSIVGDGLVNTSLAQTIVPPGRSTYVAANTDFTLTATADPGAVFTGWSGTAAGALADATAPVITLNIAADSDITANFTTAPLTISSLRTAAGSDQAWIFGGVVARISGTGLNAAGTPIVSFDSGAAGGPVTAVGFRAARDGSSIDVVVPASNDTSGAATVGADVTVSLGGSSSNTLTNGLAYKRYDTDASGVVTTAAILSNPGASNTVQVSVNGTNTDGAAQLTLPSLTSNLPAGVNTVYVIARTANDGTVKQTTPPLTALGTQAIADALGANTTIDNVTDFSLHLYAAVEIAKNTPTVGSPTLSNANGLVAFDRPIGANGVPVSGTPATFTQDVTATALTATDAQNSLTTWGVASEFDYVNEVTTLIDKGANATVGYQSEVVTGEYTADGAGNLTTLTSRLYSLNGFSVRQNAIITADLASAIRLNTASGTASGSTNGGTSVQIVSPFGDLAWLDHVTFGSAVQSNFVSTSGDTEYAVTVASPANSAGVVDVALYSKADPTTPVVNLERVFEYEAAARKLPIGLILTLLGLLIAIIGLAAGGDSGGGGGGPCFIATAAYGTPMAQDIDALRAVRDEYLLNNVLGTAFVDTYYRVSPTIADAVASSPVLAATVRVTLVPVIALSKMLLASPMLALLLAMSLGAIFMLRRRGHGHKA